MSGMCQILGDSLISCHSKKQTSAALSTTKVKYIAIGNCSTQILFIMHQLLDFNLSFKYVPIMCYNTGAIILSKYIVLHSRAKNIDIKHHFILNHRESEKFSLQFVNSKISLLIYLQNSCLKKDIIF